MYRVVCSLVFLLAACSASEKYDSAFDRGYSDGFASGYNTTCEIRVTLIAGDWETNGYKLGYDSGYSAGSEQCRSDQAGTQ